MSTFFTSDHHFGHHKMLRYQAHTRPYPNVGVMDEHLIELWNELVADNDIVHHLGDLCLGTMVDALRYLSQLKGRIKFTPGNHDYWVGGYEKSGTTILSASGHPVEIMPLYHTVKIGDQRVMLCHYPMRSWHASYYGSWHLYGHMHTTGAPWGMSLNVGVDLNEGRPFKEEDITMKMQENMKHFHKAARGV